MRTLNFNKHNVVIPSELEIEHSTKYFDDYTRTSKNGLFYGINLAYNKHYELSISPDDVYNTICAIWGKYITINAENFRKQIVSHDGKKSIRLYGPDSTIWDKDKIIDACNSYIMSIENDGNISFSWMKNKFSETTEEDILIRNIAILSSQKQYYKYEYQTLCWLPKINLLGTVEDWISLKKSISDMTTYDSHMKIWKNKLQFVLDRFIEGEEVEEFWQTPLLERTGGSGSVDYYTGWATVFNPFNEKGQWGNIGLYYRIPVTDNLDLVSDFEVECFDMSGIQNGTLKISAGPSKIKLNSNGIKVENGFYFVYIKKNL